MAALAEHVLDFDVEQVTNSRKMVLASVVRALDDVLARGEQVAAKHRFAQFFDQVVTVLELPDDELASLFQVSRPTIGRWRRGEAAPHPLGRAPLFEVLRRVARKKMLLMS